METSKGQNIKLLKYSDLKEFIGYYEKSLGYFTTGIKNKMVIEA